MKHVIKASFYHLLHTKYFFYTLVCTILIELAMGLTAYMQGGETAHLIRGSMDNWIFFSSLIAMLMLAAMIGGDFKDKILYYEVMSGHSRKEIYLGRLVPYLISYLVILTVAFICIFSMGCIMSDWMTVIGGPGKMVIDYILILFNSLPFFTMCVCCIYIADNWISGLGLEWVLWIMEMLTMNIYCSQIQSIWMQCLKRVATLWMVHPIIMGSITNGEIAGMIIADMIKCILCLLLGIKIFEKRDLI